MKTRLAIICALTLALGGTTFSSKGKDNQIPTQSDQLFALRKSVLDSGGEKVHGSRYGSIPFRDYGNWHVFLIPNGLNNLDSSRRKDPAFYRTMYIIVENTTFKGTNASIQLTYCSVLGNGKEYHYGLSNISIKGHPMGDKDLLNKLGVNLSNLKEMPNQRVEPTVKTSVDPVEVQGADTAHP